MRDAVADQEAMYTIEMLKRTTLNMQDAHQQNSVIYGEPQQDIELELPQSPSASASAQQQFMQTTGTSTAFSMGSAATSAPSAASTTDYTFINKR